MPKSSIVDMTEFKAAILRIFDELRDKDVLCTLVCQRMGAMFPQTQINKASAYQRVVKVINSLMADGLVERAGYGVYRRTALEFNPAKWKESSERETGKEERKKKEEAELYGWMDDVLLEVLEHGVPLKYLKKLKELPAVISDSQLVDGKLRGVWTASVSKLMFHHKDKAAPDTLRLSEFTDVDIAAEFSRRQKIQEDKKKEEREKVAADKKKLRIGLIGPQPTQWASRSSSWEQLGEKPYTLVFVDKNAKLTNPPKLDHLIVVEQMVSRHAGVYCTLVKSVDKANVHTVPNLGQLTTGLTTLLKGIAG